jgi:ribonuclease D
MQIAGRDVVLINRNEQLDRAVAELGDGSPLVVDTEFHSERRYAPSLVLVQLARLTAGPIYVIDATAVGLSPLRAVLDGADWVAHGASQDVALLHARLGCRPRSLLDTQLFAGMAGLPHPARLGDLCSAVLDLPLDKSSSLSDWTARPLSDQQLRYAAADVAVLPQLLGALEDRLDDRRRRWAREAGEELVSAALAPPDPDRHWRRLRIAHSFDAETRSVLHAIAAWREGLAADRDRPPHYILSNPLLLDLARRRPRTVGELRENRRVPDRLARQHGATLVGLVVKASAEPLPVPSEPSPDTQRRGRWIELWGATRATRLGLAAELLLPEQVALELAAGAAVEGWRAEALGDELAAVQAGRLGLRLAPDGVETVTVR